METTGLNSEQGTKNKLVCGASSMTHTLFEHIMFDDGPRFGSWLDWGLTVWSLHVLTMSEWVPFSFLTQANLSEKKGLG